MKKQRVSAYHWPSSGFILKVMLQECYTIIANAHWCWDLITYRFDQILFIRLFY